MGTNDIIDQYLETDWSKGGTIKDVFPGHPKSWDDYTANQRRKARWVLGKEHGSKVEGAIEELTGAGGAGSYDRPMGTYGKGLRDRKKVLGRKRKKSKVVKEIGEGTKTVANAVWITGMPKVVDWAEEHAGKAKFAYFPASRGTRDLVMVPTPGSGNLGNLVDRLSKFGVKGFKVEYNWEVGDFLIGPGKKTYTITGQKTGKEAKK